MSYDILTNTIPQQLVTNLINAAIGSAPASGATLVAIGRAAVVGLSGAIVYSVFEDDVDLFFDTIFGWQDTYVELLSGTNGNLLGGALYTDNIPGTPAEAAAELVRNLASQVNTGNLIRIESVGFFGGSTYEFQVLSGDLLSKFAAVYGAFTPGVLGSAYKGLGEVGTWDWAADADGTARKNQDIIFETSGFTLFEKGTKLALRVFDGEVGDWINLTIDVGDIGVGTGKTGNGGIGGTDQVIFGTAGNDRLSAKGSGKTYILAGDGIDIVQGSAGVDHVLLESTFSSSTNLDSASPNEAYAAGGDDYVMGGGGVDKIFGGKGEDRLNGNNGADIINGEDDDDVIFGDGQDENVAKASTNGDILIGGKGQDTLHGGEGNDILFGGSMTLVEGNAFKADYLATKLNDLVTDNLLGGAGNDTYLPSGILVKFEHPEFQQVDLSGSITSLRQTLAPKLDYISDSDGKGVFDPYRWANEQPPAIMWRAFDSSGLLPIYTNQYRIQDVGWDFMGQMTGATYSQYLGKIIGSELVICYIQDRILSPSIRTIELDLWYKMDVGVAFLSAGSDQAGLRMATAFAALEETSLAAGEYLGMRFTTAMNQLPGSVANDTINGGAQDDYVRAGAGADTINTGDGSDVIDAGSGNDNISGGDGKDAIYGEDGNDVLSGGQGSDQLRGGNGSDTAVFTGNRADYSVTVQGLNLILKNVNQNSAEYGDVDTTDNIEFFQFADVRLSLADLKISNNRPVAVDDEFVMLEDASVLVDVIANDTDADGNVISLVTVTAIEPANVTLVIEGTKVRVTPAPDWFGTVVFDYVINDGRGGIDIGRTTVTVNNINDGPALALPLGEQTALEDQSFEFILPPGAFVDLEGDVLSFSATQVDGSELPSWLTVDSVTGSIRGTPPQDFNGELLVRLIASDGQLTASDDFALTIAAANDAPVLSLLLPDVSSQEDQLVNFVLPPNTFFDVDGDLLTLAASLDDGTPLPAWLSFNSTTGAFTGTPPLNFNGSLAVKVSASDGVLSAFDTFTLNVTAANDAPHALQDGNFNVAFNTPLTMSLAWLIANDTDVDGDVLNILSVQDVMNGSVTLGADGNILFSPNAGYSGAASFTYKVSDGNGGVSTTLVTLTVATATIGTLGTNGADVLYGTNADDFINALAGDDFLYAGNGADLVRGGDGNDTLHGNNGNDVINGDAGDDVILGANGNDILNGQSGNDILSGGNGNDQFVFSSGFGNDKVTDFRAGASLADVLVLSLGGSFGSFTEVLAAARQVGANTVISVSDSDTITLNGVNKSALVTNDFLFA